MFENKRSRDEVMIDFYLFFLQLLYITVWSLAHALRSDQNLGHGLF
jgi:hypothetical protein